MNMSCRTVSFYSFKGGTGRSTSLCNVAYSLAKQGARVGCMDFDLAAPGLHLIFKDIGKLYIGTDTIHNYLDPEKPKKDIEEYVIRPNESWNDTSMPGEIFLMAGSVEPPGKSSIEDKWTDIEVLIADFKRAMDLDYLLLDSRSGLSQHMVPMFDQADDFLAFHKWTNQHRVGTEKLTSWIFETGIHPKNTISVASNIPESVREEDIAEWARMDLMSIDNYHIINESEILKEDEQVITRTHPETKVAKQFEELAEIIRVD